MKPTTVTKTVFTLDELSDTARQYALEKMSALLYDWIDASQITECLNGELLAMLTGECVGEISSKELTKRVGLQIESLTCEETVREYLNNDYPRRFTENGEIDSIEFWGDK